MTDRMKLMVEFLGRHGWGDATRRPLADDASFRRYERLVMGDAHAVLMDAPPQFEDVRPFVAVAKYLQGLGFGAPEIYGHDIDNGFLLLEDMGDALFAQIIHHDPALESPLYTLAVDGLVALHKAHPPISLAITESTSHKLVPYDMDLLLQEVGLFADWYIPSLTGKPMSDEDREAFIQCWRDSLYPVTQNLDCLVLRDYHAENLMVRSKGCDLTRLGLLDFQDATRGHKAYDLVSLLQDARRDVSPAMEQKMLQYYITKTEAHDADFRRDYALLGAQRNVKIIGIFIRLYLRDNKSSYLDKIPWVWGLLNRDLAHPALAKIRQWMSRHISLETRVCAVSPKSFMPKYAMILAAGLGKRMRPLSDHCPKPLIKVAGQPLIAWSFAGLCAWGVRDIVVNIHYLADQMIDFVDHHHDHRLTITLSDEREQLLDSGGGVKAALHYLGHDPFFVLNSDMIWRDGARPMLQRLQAFWQDDAQKNKMDILMLLIPCEAAFGYDGRGDYNRQADGRLRARGMDDGADYVYGGIMIMRPDCFEGMAQDVFSLKRQFDMAEKQGRLYGLVHDGAWYHVGTPDACQKLEKGVI